MAVDDNEAAVPETSSETVNARRLGAHGRRRAKDMVARQANGIAKANKKVLQKKFDKIDLQPKSLEVLPPDPKGVARVPHGHPWAKIHKSHVLIVTHKYAACYRCGRKAATNCNMKEACTGHRSKAGEKNIRLMTHGRNPVPGKAWPPDDAPHNMVFPCFRLLIVPRGDEFEEV